MNRAAFAFLLMTAFAVCACTPSQEEFNRADFGIEPSYDDARSIADDWLAANLIDPDSRKVSITSGPERYFWFPAHPHYGFLVCGMVNAKNRLGGYVGREPFYILIRDGRVISGSVTMGEGTYFGPAPCNPA